eukprot:766336-Hanusia_phi.AAC.1
MDFRHLIAIALLACNLGQGQGYKGHQSQEENTFYKIRANDVVIKPMLGWCADIGKNVTSNISNTSSSTGYIDGCDRNYRTKSNRGQSYCEDPFFGGLFGCCFIQEYDSCTSCHYTALSCIEAAKQCANRWTNQIKTQQGFLPTYEIRRQTCAFNADT